MHSDENQSNDHENIYRRQDFEKIKGVRLSFNFLFSAEREAGLVKATLALIFFSLVLGFLLILLHIMTLGEKCYL